MKRIIARAILAGIAAGFAGVALAQGANADTTIIRSWETMPETTFVTTPTIERVVTSPTVVEETLPTRVIESPVVIREKVKTSHLLHLGLFPLLDFSAL